MLGNEESSIAHTIGAGKPGETAQEMASNRPVERCLMHQQASSSRYSMT